jgi:hypothetical protein
MDPADSSGVRAAAVRQKEITGTGLGYQEKAFSIFASRGSTAPGLLRETFFFWKSSTTVLYNT